jgi:histidyl-tRNA synthetase
MENLSTLLGKYGEEGDNLLFKILNSGNFMDGVEVTDDYKKMSIAFCERGLRYDLTVPFARFVVQHRNDITFPFKRYQIQPVWRADRPQKGRYREFYQCDADIIGSDSLLNEWELVQMVDEVFRRLDINVVLKINNRKILAGIAEMIGMPDKLVDITVAIDKLDKIGLDNVTKELLERGLSHENIAALQPIFDLSGTVDEKLNTLEALFATSEIGQKGIAEMRTLFGYISTNPTGCDIELDLTLARGLNYYTGAIFEVKAQNVSIGSISGGGRYDNLTGIFGMPDVSGVGISFGADRIYDVLTELNKFPSNLEQLTEALFINFGEKETEYCIRCAAMMRKAGIKTEIYPDNAKMKKQMSYADNKKIPYVVFIGQSEIENNTVTIKNMANGNQETINLNNLIEYFKKK